MQELEFNNMEEVLMGTQEKGEREINLVDLFWKILLNWRKLISFGILFAILVSGMRYFLDMRAYQAFKNIDVEKIKEDMEPEELKTLADAVSLQRRIDDFESYLDKSAIMKMDPYAKPVLELQYYVQSDYVINYTKDKEHDYTLELISMYCNYIGSGEMTEKVIEELSLPISQEDFAELVTVSGPRGNDSGTIFFTISYADSENLEKIAGVVKSLLEQKSLEFQKIGSHKLNLINESQNIVVDSSLAEKKNNIYNNITTLQVQLKTAKAGLSEAQMTLFDLEVSEMRGEEIEEEEPGFHIKYMILGMMAGIFLVCAWIACKVIFASKLQTAKEINGRFGLRLLGAIEMSGNQKKRFLSSVDNFLLKLKNRRRREVAVDRQLEVIAANIILSCKQREIDSIYMTGSEYEKVDKSTLDKLKKEVSKQKIKILDGGNIMYDAVSMQSAMEISHVVLIELKGISAYNEIDKEVDLLEQYHANILGVIVL